MKRIFSLFLILSVLSSLTLVGCVNNKTIVAEVDTDRIRLEHFEQMKDDGPYMITTNNDETVVVFVNPIGFEYDSTYKIVDNEIIFRFTKDEISDDFERFDGDAYLIKNHYKEFGDDSIIRVFVDGKEDSFRNVIICDKIFKWFLNLKAIKEKLHLFAISLFLCNKNKKFN